MSSSSDLEEEEEKRGGGGWERREEIAYSKERGISVLTSSICLLKGIIPFF